MGWDEQLDGNWNGKWNGKWDGKSDGNWDAKWDEMSLMQTLEINIYHQAILFLSIDVLLSPKKCQLLEKMLLNL